MPPVKRQRCERCTGGGVDKESSSRSGSVSPQQHGAANEDGGAAIEVSTPANADVLPPLCYGGCGCSVCGCLPRSAEDAAHDAEADAFVHCSVCRAPTHVRCSVADDGLHYCSPHCLWGCEIVANPKFCPAISGSIELQYEKRIAAIAADVTNEERLELTRQFRYDAVVAYFEATSLTSVPFLAPALPFWSERDHLFLLDLLSARGQARILCMLQPLLCAVGSKIVVPRPKLLQEQAQRLRQNARYLQAAWQRDVAALHDDWGACGDL